MLEHVQGVCSTAAVDYWTVLSLTEIFGSIVCWNMYKVCSTAAVDYWTVLSQKYLDEFCANSAATKLIWNSSASSLVLFSLLYNIYGQKLLLHLCN